ncbi:tail sheath protein [Arthrobacter phage Timinator]|uniref:Tail sheath protein n=2 Tax=Marthavirus barretlemon TaxID=2560300 RepID=A0A386KM99_9CAUD|nr:tail sheath protein [Arthrobacter phage Timinator]AYD86486.1 tail sheath protein [Arthrobacter phage LeeroyJ]
MGIGVEVTTSLRSGPSNPGVQSGRLHIAGLTAKGPTGKGVIVRSLAQFLATFGDRTSYNTAMFDTARLFFEEGGSELVVTRVVGPAATKGTLTLKDTLAVNTLKIDALNPGTTSSALTAEVKVNGSTFDLIISENSTVLSRYTGMTSPTDVVAAAATNPYVKITSLGSVSAAPANNPALLAPTALSAGTDDRSSVTAAIVVSALDNAGTLAEGGAVAAPGYTVATIGALLAAHAKTYNKIALLSPGVGTTQAEAVAAAAALTATSNNDAAGIFWPSVVIPDGAGTRVVGPEGYVAAVRAKAHRDVGFWKVPAGDTARMRWATGTDVQLDVAGNNTLAAVYVNGIVTTGTNTRLYGYASMSTDRENLGLLTARDALNNLALRIDAALEPFVFQVLDGRKHLLGQVEGAVVGVVDPIAKRDGFYALTDAEGNLVDPGYRVVVDESINTVTSASNNTVLVSVTVRLSPTAQLIQAEIIKVPLAAAV